MPEIAVVNASYSSSACGVTKENGGGYSTMVAAVVDKGDSSYTIDLTVSHDGCSTSNCPELSAFSVEADLGTYSNVVFEGIGGVLDFGPDLSGDDFQGFKVDYTSGLGNGTPGMFLLKYTLNYLQDQKMVAHGASNPYSASFTVADFNYVLECNTVDIASTCFNPNDSNSLYEIFSHGIFNDSGNVQFNSVTTANITGKIRAESGGISFNNINSRHLQFLKIRL